MLHVIKKWRIFLYFDLSEKSITLVIHDDHYSNMLRKLNDICWDIDPTKITIELQPHDEQRGTFNG